MQKRFLKNNYLRLSDNSEKIWILHETIARNFLLTPAKNIYFGVEWPCVLEFKSRVTYAAPSWYSDALHSLIPSNRFSIDKFRFGPSVPRWMLITITAAIITTATTATAATTAATTFIIIRRPSLPLIIITAAITAARPTRRSDGPESSAVLHRGDQHPPRSPRYATWHFKDVTTITVTLAHLK